MADIITEAARQQFLVQINKLLTEEKYSEKISEMISEDQSRLSISLDDLRKFAPELSQQLLDHPLFLLKDLEQALKTVIDSDHKTDAKSQKKYRVTFEGNFGTHYITPRGLKSDLLNKLVKVQGIVTRMSIVRPKLISSEHYCEETGKSSNKVYGDNYELTTMEAKNNSIPTHDSNGRPLMFEYGLSQYKDHQTLTIQELPERAPTGQLPRSIEIIIEEDLVDRVKPGDRIEAVGVYKTVGSFSSSVYGSIKTMMIASNVYSISAELALPKLTGKDIQLIKEFARKENIVSLLSASFSPSIYGHDQIKKALVLLLLGGEEKNLENGTHLRGDINVMLIGDPSTAKSQLLRSVLNIAPLATNTTGRGASGVGLTAAVSVDKDTGERHLEAGAMVLADRGVICIDEFDKMNEVDRVAIHEVMEQQTVTIAKAGIHTSLNARCSVVAAANPQFGMYIREKSPSVNIALPDSLLSRFDLLFIVLDHNISEIDRLISSRVIHNHCSLTGINEDMDLDTPVIEPLPPLDDESEQKPATFKFEGKEMFTRAFLKKFIHYAKNSVHPVLSNQSSDFISKAWAELRTKDEEAGRQRVVTITVRSLETLIRLSTAIAKAHLSREVTKKHCEEALKLMKFAIFQEDDKPSLPAQEEQMADVLSSLGTKSRRKKKEDDVEKVKELLSSSKKSVQKVTAQLKKQVFRCAHENLKDKESPMIKVQQLWKLVQKMSENKVEDVDHLVEIVRALDNEGKFVYQEKDKTIILVI